MRRSAPRADQASRTSPSTRASRPSILATASRARAPWSRLQWRPRRRQPPCPKAERAAPPGEPDEQDAAEAQTAIYNQDPGGELRARRARIGAGPTGSRARGRDSGRARGRRSGRAPDRDTRHGRARTTRARAGARGATVRGARSRTGGRARASRTPARRPRARRPQKRVSPAAGGCARRHPGVPKDAPEDDELWFEQGKPKDFDF